MPQYESPSENESVASQSDEPISGLDTSTAIASVWQYWLVTLVATAGAVFFLTTEVWGNTGEIFYVIIFSVIAVIAASAGALTARYRTQKYHF